MRPARWNTQHAWMVGGRHQTHQLTNRLCSNSDRVGSSNQAINAPDFCTVSVSEKCEKHPLFGSFDACVCWRGCTSWAVEALFRPCVRVPHLCNVCNSHSLQRRRIHAMLPNTPLTRCAPRSTACAKHAVFWTSRFCGSGFWIRPVLARFVERLVLLGSRSRSRFGALALGTCLASLERLALVAARHTSASQLHGTTPLHLTLHR